MPLAAVQQITGENAMAEKNITIQRLFLILTALAAVSGCATTQPPPRFQFPAGTRVGIVNQLEPYATHQNFSEARIRNFTKTVNVDWDIPGNMQEELTQGLQHDPRYKVIPITGENPIPIVIDRVSGPGAVVPQAAAALESVAGKYNVNVIIIIKSFKGPTRLKLDKHGFILQGYGLFTRQFLFFNRAFAYANLAVIVFKTGPLTYIGSGEPTIDTDPLEDFKLSGDLKIIPPSEINKLEPIIKKYAHQAVVKALHTANLIQ